MNPDTINQALNLIDKSQNILLLTHAKADCDGLGAMLATYTVLKELGKEVTAVTNDPTPENLAFLPSINIVQNSLASGKDFIISLDITSTPLSKIKYKLENDRINIIVTPKSGTFTKEDVSFSQGSSKFDLIIAMDAGNLEHLGQIYDQNAEIFFETPIINIDHHASNTDFGQVNLVDVVASSATEVLYYVMKAMEKKYDKKLITEDIATLLLSGIITDTGSFQHANTSPKSMEVSAKLLDMGARQQEIIKNIYKTKKLSTLKLWGIVLSKVQVDPIYRMVWSTIGREDLQEADADADESEGIIDDLLSNAPGAEVIMLIKDNVKENYVSVSMRSTTNAVDVSKISTEMGGGGHVRAAGYKVKNGKPFDQVISEILKKVRKYQAERLNIHPDDVETHRGASKEEGPEKPLDKQPDKPPDKPSDKPPEKKSTYLEFKSTKKVETRDLASKDEEPKKPKPDDVETHRGASKEKGEPKPEPTKGSEQVESKKEDRQKPRRRKRPQRPKRERPQPDKPQDKPQDKLSDRPSEQPSETIPPPPIAEEPKEKQQPDKPQDKPQDKQPGEAPDWLKEE